MEGPAIPVWGPALWSLFHSLAAKAGKKNGLRAGVSLESEEKRLWRSMMLAFRSTIPCPACQKHYNEYLITHPLAPVLDGKQGDWSSQLRAWFYTFHNAVRSSKGQPLEFREEQLVGYEATTRAEMVTWKQTLTEQMRRGMVVHIVMREDMLKALRFMEELILLIF
jgi:hypothetical protein